MHQWDTHKHLYRIRSYSMGRCEKRKQEEVDKYPKPASRLGAPVYGSSRGKDSWDLWQGSSSLATGRISTGQCWYWRYSGPSSHPQSRKWRRRRRRIGSVNALIWIDYQRESSLSPRLCTFWLAYSRLLWANSKPCRVRSGVIIPWSLPVKTMIWDFGSRPADQGKYNDGLVLEWYIAYCVTARIDWKLLSDSKLTFIWGEQQMLPWKRYCCLLL